MEKKDLTRLVEIDQAKNDSQNRRIFTYFDGIRVAQRSKKKANDQGGRRS